MKTTIFKILSFIAVIATVAFISQNAGASTGETIGHCIEANVFTISIAQERSRAVFKALTPLFNSVEMSYLMCENQITDQNSTYKFDFRLAAGTANETLSPNQQLLDQGDIFVVTQLGLFMYKKVATTQGYITEGFQTGVNPLYFIAGGGWNPLHLHQFYDASSLRFHVGDKDYFQTLDTRQFKCQHNLQGNSSSDIWQEQYGESDGYIALPNMLLINGSDQAFLQHTVQLFTGFAAANTVASTSNWFAYRPCGILIRGAADTGSQQIIRQAIKEIE
jgi:hypothetical protein